MKSIPFCGLNGGSGGAGGYRDWSHLFLVINKFDLCKCNALVVSNCRERPGRVDKRMGCFKILYQN